MSRREAVFSVPLIAGETWREFAHHINLRNADNGTHIQEKSIPRIMGIFKWIELLESFSSIKNKIKSILEWYQNASVTRCHWLLQQHFVVFSVPIHSEKEKKTSWGELVDKNVNMKYSCQNKGRWHALTSQ